MCYKMCLFQLLKYEDMLLFFVMSDNIRIAVGFGLLVRLKKKSEDVGLSHGIMKIIVNCNPSTLASAAAELVESYLLVV